MCFKGLPSTTCKRGFTENDTFPASVASCVNVEVAVALRTAEVPFVSVAESCQANVNIVAF